MNTHKPEPRILAVERYWHYVYLLIYSSTFYAHFWLIEVEILSTSNNHGFCLCRSASQVHDCSDADRSGCQRDYNRDAVWTQPTVGRSLCPRAVCTLSDECNVCRILWTAQLLCLHDGVCLLPVKKCRLWSVTAVVCLQQQYYFRHSFCWSLFQNYTRFGWVPTGELLGIPGAGFKQAG